MSKHSPAYLIGIDLGTTHTLLAYADRRADPTDIRVFPIEQLVAPGEVAARPLLPSLRYHPLPGELTPGDTALPWPPAALEQALPVAVQGQLARELGAKTPGRLVASAKSWLSHAGVDRGAPILPWGGEGVEPISPLAASAGYLAYLRCAWNHAHPRQPLENQEIVLTLPASFDETARLLTVEAARLAGLPRVRLLEEPQAACYDWLHRHRHDPAAALGDARLLLVTDVGGGTTDLTLIRVEAGAGAPRLTRIGVGEHLMLGGDNMDLALAHLAEQRLGGGRLGAGQLAQLLQQCRSAKERLLAATAPDTATVTLLGAGARLVGGARAVELSRDEVRALVVDGFLPRVEADERPAGRRGAIVAFGLPYAADPAVSRHLAAFLARHRRACAEALGDRLGEDDGRAPLPDALLLNGGVFNSPLLAGRLLEILTDWRGAPPRLLANPDPDLAVARGAVAYALARSGQGLKIGGGSARSYFLRIDAGEGVQRGVCVLPRGSEEGNEQSLAGRGFSLRLGRPVQFHLLSTSADTPYRSGELADLDYQEFQALPPLATVLEPGAARADAEVPVRLTAQLTEVGTLALACQATADPTRRWALEFQLRGRAGEAAPPPAAAHPRLEPAAERIERVFGHRLKGVGPKEVKTLRQDLEKLLGKREGWDTALLRELFGLLWESARRRRRSADHERVWLSLAGYCLRPGFGAPLDDWRVGQLWSLYEQGVQYGNDAQVVSEWWTLWRRVAGGLSAAAQARLLDDIAPRVRPQPPKAKAPKGVDDQVRLAGVLERLPASRKAELGGWLLERLARKGETVETWWALGRIGARVPFHGGAQAVVPAAVAAAWLEALLAQDWRRVQPAAFAAALVARQSGDRARDLDPDLRAQVVRRLREARAPESWLRMVEEVVELDEADQKRMFGESLPPGLRLVD